MVSKNKKARREDALPTKPATRAQLPLLPNLDLFPTTGYSRWSDLQPFVRYSREWVRQREQAGRFPKRVYLSKRCAVWSNAEIRNWLVDPIGYRAEAHFTREVEPSAVERLQPRHDVESSPFGRSA
jgi:prophage regulatory protein